MAKTRKHHLRKRGTRRLRKGRISRGGGGGASKAAAPAPPATATRRTKEERNAACAEREAARAARQAARVIARADTAAKRAAKKARRDAAYAKFKAEATEEAKAEATKVRQAMLRTFVPIIQADPSKKAELLQTATIAGETAGKALLIQKLSSFVFNNTNGNDLEELLEMPELNFEAAASGP